MRLGCSGLPVPVRLVAVYHWQPATAASASARLPLALLVTGSEGALLREQRHGVASGTQRCQWHTKLQVGAPARGRPQASSHGHAERHLNHYFQLEVRVCGAMIAIMPV